LGDLSRITDFIRGNEHYCKQTSELVHLNQIKISIVKEAKKIKNKKQKKLEKKYLIRFVRNAMQQNQQELVNIKKIRLNNCINNKPC